jgi:hypothetical protein
VLASRYGRSTWWGFLLPVVVNVGAPALRDLTDPVATAAACGLLTAWLLGWRPIWLACWAVAAVLSREQNLAIVGIVLFGCLTANRGPGLFFRREKRLVSPYAAAALLVTVAVWLAWVGVLYGFYGTLPFLRVNVGAPLAGMWWRWTHLEGQVGAARLPIHAVAMVFLTMQIAISLLLPLARAEATAMLTALAGAALAFLAGPAIFENGQSYTRVFLWMPLGIWIWSMQTRRSWPIMLLSPAALWPLFALVQVWRAT